MDSKRFNEVLEGVIDKCRHTLVAKAGEYATDFGIGAGGDGQ